MIHYFEVQPFIATLAGLFLSRGLCYVISKDSISIADHTFTTLAQFQVPLPGGTFLSWRVVIAVSVVAAAFVVLHYTRFGRRVYAIGGNEQSALLMGVPVGAHQDRGLHRQRLLLRARRRAVHAVHPVGRPAARGRHGARRHRRRRHRRHAAHRRLRLRAGHGARRAGARR